MKSKPNDPSPYSKAQLKKAAASEYNEEYARMEALRDTPMQRAANVGKSVNVGTIGHVDPPRKRPRLYRHEGIGHVISEANIESSPSNYSPIYL